MMNASKRMGPINSIIPEMPPLAINIIHAPGSSSLDVKMTETIARQYSHLIVRVAGIFMQSGPTLKVTGLARLLAQGPVDRRVGPQWQGDTN